MSADQDKNNKTQRFNSNGSVDYGDGVLPQSSGGSGAQTESEEQYNPAQNQFEKDWDNKTQRFNSNGSVDYGDGVLPQSSGGSGAQTESEEGGDTGSRLQKLEDKYGGNYRSGYRGRSLADKEGQGDSNWDTNVSAKNATKMAKRGLKISKSGAALIGFIGLIISIMGLMFSIINGSLGILGLTESTFGKIGQRAENVFAMRANKVMAKKMSQNLTTGCTIKIKCRYKGMTKREIKKFNRRGMAQGVRVITEPSSIPGRQKIVAIETYEPVADAKVDGDGKVEGRTIKSYRADEIRSAFTTDPKIFNGTRAFYKSTVQFHGGNVARTVYKKMGVYLGKRQVNSSDATTEQERMRAQQRDLLSQAQTGDGEPSANTKRLIGELPDEAKGDLEDRTNSLSDAANTPNGDISSPQPGSSRYERIFGNTAERIRNIGKGYSPNPLSFIMNYCTVRTLIQVANSARKIDQMVQVVKFSMLFATLAHQIKAGEADGTTSATIATAMGVLTSKDSDGKSAFDSAGYNMIMRGSIRPGLNEDVGKFQNGGTAPGLLGSAATATTNGLGPMCKIASSPWTAIAGLTLDGLSLLLGVFSFGAGTAAVQAVKVGGVQGGKAFAQRFIRESIEEGLQKTLQIKAKQNIEGTSTKSIIWKKMNDRYRRVGAEAAFFFLAVPPLIEAIARMSSETVAKDLFGADAGNAFVSGAGAAVSKTSQAQGLEPITADEAVAQDVTGADGDIKRAKLEGVNQLDISNRHSFANQFTLALMPSFSNLSSPSSIPQGIFGIVSSGYSSIFTKAYADDTHKAQYEYCKDNDYQSASVKIATDMFCNPQYGLDLSVVDGPEYDPEVITNYLYDEGLLTEDGKPQGEFQEFTKKCFESEALVGQDENGKVHEECVKRDQKTRSMRLYCIDASIDNDMTEGESSACIETSTSENPAASNPETTSTPGVLPSGSAQELAQQIVDSSNVEISPQYETHIQNIASGNNDCPVSEKILGLIISLSQEYKIRISSLNRSCTGSTVGAGTRSWHWQGKAVDIDMVDNVLLGTEAAYSSQGKEKAIKVFNHAAKIVPKNSEFGQVDQCGIRSSVDLNGITDIASDPCHHIHIAIP